MQKISIIIPAHNEQQRIKRTLDAYITFFNALKDKQICQADFIVVLNGCVDDTITVVGVIQATHNNVHIVDIKPAGKGLAVKAGFLDALHRTNDLIGFVDADMATSPQAFYDLIAHIDECDGIIASRYMPESKVYPPRPWIKRWGSRLVYEPLVRLLFGINYYDFQCGAKIFRREVINKIACQMVVKRWSVDVEILYLCKKFGFKIKEYPTEWHDQVGSKLRFSSGFSMHTSLIALRLKHSVLGRWFNLR